MTPTRANPLTKVHTLVIGSGAAGLNAAVQLVMNGVEDVLILTEGLGMGTSINTGSDKQTYYKLALGGGEGDSTRQLAETYFAGGAMHGDLALVEASLSAQAFMHLVNLGVPFPRDAFGQYVGYKTDHDPRQRATSIGPYTSREMCRCLIGAVRRLGIRVLERRSAIRLVTQKQRVIGAVALDETGAFETYLAENIIFAVGGPGGLYKTSVYPVVHTGAIGLGLMAGASARNLSESQFGLASTQFRWNVSGTYMQVVPRIFSQGPDGGESEFLRPYFDSAAEMNGRVFLKGYQWPFDAQKVMGGSSLIDLLVYIETELKGRRVYLDYRRNGDGFALEELPEEARQYLERSGARQPTPYERLKAMNPGAAALYLEHGIDLAREPLEVAVCAQHNNGGLAGSLWWESVNLRHLFPIGEVNGSHGIRRPGGAALNAGQVGGFRAAQYIANRYAGWSLPEAQSLEDLQSAMQCEQAWAEKGMQAQSSWEEERSILQARMSKAGALIRSLDGLAPAAAEAWQQVRRLEENGCRRQGPAGLKEAFCARQLCFAHAVYLDALLFTLKANVGSRGSAVALDASGQKVHPRLGEAWRILPEDDSFRSLTLETDILPGGVRHTWAPCHPIPESDGWFETAWARFRSGEIYDQV